MSKIYASLVSRETIATIVFGYLAVGAVIWIVLDRLGVIAKTHRARVARGASTVLLHYTIATLFVIFGWPIFAVRYVRRICA